MFAADVHKGDEQGRFKLRIGTVQADQQIGSTIYVEIGDRARASLQLMRLAAAEIA
jgi:hypothetical protein